MSNAHKEVGTLKEIGAQAGDRVVDCNMFEADVVLHHGRICVQYDDWKEPEDRDFYNGYRIISRAQPGPVRTVTRLEIVPGKYGNVTVCGDGWPSVNGVSNTDELADAIATLTAIRDAMQENTTG